MQPTTIRDEINAQRASLAVEILTRQYEIQPDLARRYNETDRQASLTDIQHTLNYLCQAIEYNSPSLFIDYAGWLSTVLASRGLPAADLANNFTCIEAVLQERFGAGALDQETGTLLNDYLRPAAQASRTLPDPNHSYLDPSLPYASQAAAYLQALLAANRSQATQLVNDLVKEGVSPREIYLHIFQPVQHEIGRLWQFNRIDVGQEHYATAVTQMTMAQLYPLIFSTERAGRTLVAACVGSELHEIGIRMVADFFEMAGWDTFYMGANTPANSVVRALAERRADVLAISATMTMHVSGVQRLIQSVRQSGAGAVKILVGGYPFNLAPDLWKTIGADGFGRSAEEAIQVANRLTGMAA